MWSLAQVRAEMLTAPVRKCWSRRCVVVIGHIPESGAHLLYIYVCFVYIWPVCCMCNQYLIFQLTWINNPYTPCLLLFTACSLRSSSMTTWFVFFFYFVVIGSFEFVVWVERRGSGPLLRLDDALYGLNWDRCKLPNIWVENEEFRNISSDSAKEVIIHLAKTWVGDVRKVNPTFWRCCKVVWSESLELHCLESGSKF
jgi:hypothetical protein